MYTEKLTEQLAVADNWTPESTTSSGTTTITGAAVDLSLYRRLVAYMNLALSGITATATATGSIKIQASTATGFASPSTITTVTATLASVTATATDTVVSAEVSGEAAGARYVRAVLVGKTSHKKIAIGGLALAGVKRYH